MDSTYSKKELEKFLDFIRAKDLVKYQTATSWCTAVTKLLSDLSEVEDMDVRKVDIDLAVHRAANREANNISPSTLNAYQKRTKRAIEEFVKWRQNPADYRPRGFSKPSASSLQKPSKPDLQPAGSKKSQSSDSVPDATHSHSSGLNLSYPLRPDFLAQIVIPRDLNQLEAKRLGAFLLTLSSDYQPA